MARTLQRRRRQQQQQQQVYTTTTGTFTHLQLHRLVLLATVADRDIVNLFRDHTQSLCDGLPHASDFTDPIVRDRHLTLARRFRGPFRVNYNQFEPILAHGHPAIRAASTI